MYWIVRLLCMAAIIVFSYGCFVLWKVGPTDGLVHFYKLSFGALVLMVLGTAIAIRVRATEWANSPSRKRRLYAAGGLLIFASAIMLLIVFLGGLAK